MPLEVLSCLLSMLLSCLPQPHIPVEPSQLPLSCTILSAHQRVGWKSVLHGEAEGQAPAGVYSALL